MAINTTLTGCPADCSGTLLLSAIPALQDCANYPQTLSQIRHLYIRPTGATDPFTNFNTTPTVTSGGIDNTEALNAKSKWLVGIGEIAAAEKTVTDYPLGKRRTTNRLYTLNFRILNLSAEQYEFLRQLQCGTLGFTFYYADLGNWLYGLSGGMEPDFITVRFPKGEGRDDKNVATIVLSWRANGDPIRRVNPHA